MQNSAMDIEVAIGFFLRILCMSTHVIPIVMKVNQYYSAQVTYVETGAQRGKVTLPISRVLGKART